MQFLQTLKNYLFSSNFNIVSPTARFSPIFYKRFLVDFVLRLFIFLPFSIFFAFLVQNGYFKEMAETMIEANQNVYGYLLVMFIYIPIALFFITSLLVSLVGSILKRNVFKLNSTEDTILPTSYTDAFLNSWKNLWYITIETLVLLFVAKFSIELIAIHTITFDLLPLVKSILITVGTSAILASLISLPWLFSSKKINSEPKDNIVAN